MTDPRLFNSLMRNDFTSFLRKSFQIVAPGASYQHNWHIDAMAYELMRCLNGENNRLLITLPPRNLKSITVSVAFVAYALGVNPRLQFIGLSYAQDLSLKYSRDTRAIMQSSFYRQAFPRTRIDPKKNSEAEFMTTRKGGRLATSIGGTLTGRGADILIIDDPHKPDESLSDVKRANVIEWYRNTLISRLNDKEGGVIIVVQQRVHEEDLAGYILEQGGWTHLNLPAIAEETQEIKLTPRLTHIRRAGEPLHAEREGFAVLEQLKRDMGSYAFAAQYQQEPAPVGGGLIKLDWFGRYDDPPQKQPGDQIVQSWDTASKEGELNDYSVCTTWLKRKHRIYLLDVYRKKLDYLDLKRAVYKYYHQYQPDRLIIEDKGSGIALIQELRGDGIYPYRYKPETDKVTRMSNETSIIEAGVVYLPKEAPWLADFEHELARFPNGKHDDQVDSLSQALNVMRTYRPSEPGIRFF